MASPGSPKQFGHQRCLCRPGLSRSCSKPGAGLFLRFRGSKQPPGLSRDRQPLHWGCWGGSSSPSSGLPNPQWGKALLPALRENLAKASFTCRRMK